MDTTWHWINEVVNQEYDGIFNWFYHELRTTNEINSINQQREKYNGTRN